MVKERGVVDREAGISMRSWGWFAYKKRDAVVCPRCGHIILPSGPSGTFDFPNVGIVVASMRGGYEVHFIDVEVKAGDTSVAFNDFDIEKRIWAESTKERPKYLWICIGRGLRNKKKPRKTYLLPLALFYELERNLERKSIPYGHAALDPYELEWKGKGIWELYGDFMPFLGEAHE
jgi:hypothetical protein